MLIIYVHVLFLIKRIREDVYKSWVNFGNNSYGYIQEEIKKRGENMTNLRL